MRCPWGRCWLNGNNPVRHGHRDSHIRSRWRQDMTLAALPSSASGQQHYSSQQRHGTGARPARPPPLARRPSACAVSHDCARYAHPVCAPDLSCRDGKGCYPYRPERKSFPGNGWHGGFRRHGHRNANSRGARLPQSPLHDSIGAVAAWFFLDRCKLRSPTDIGKGGAALVRTG